jgi:4-hydroxyphenylpyruvate dioxygenase-like putative hemolysin
MNLKNLSDFEVHDRIINKIKAENELIEKIAFEKNKIYFYIKFNTEKPLKIQKIIENYYKIGNPSFFLTREKIFIEN